jgi:hypothetical protein
MVDQDALIAALVEARALDTTYSGPTTHSLILPPHRLGLENPARERIARGLVDYTNAGELFGLLMPRRRRQSRDFRSGIGVFMATLVSPGDIISESAGDFVGICTKDRWERKACGS